MNRNDYQFLFKYILIGDSNVGKSCTLMRLLDGRFKNQHEPTLGVQFGSKLVQLHHKVIKLQIWDTAGQQSFRSITRAYYKSSIAAILVFDLTKQSSFESIKTWLYELKNHSHQKINIVLIGNKKDLSQEREVSFEAASDFATKNNFFGYYEISALTGQNVDIAFMDVAKQILNKIESGAINLQTDKALGVKPGNKNKSKYMSQNLLLLKQPLKEEPRNSQNNCQC